VELVERELEVAGRALSLLVPPDSEALLDEEAFGAHEFMPYWAELWPSGLALAEAVSAARPGGRIVELGCGLGLPSLVAALDGAAVLATDWAADAIALLERNAARVGATLEARRWNWADPPPGRADLVLAADVLYEERNGAPVLAALDALTDEAWIADPGRPAAPAFFAAAGVAWEIDAIAHAGSPKVVVHRLRRKAPRRPAVDTA
jgi:predicted nicotinamide N-methyase